MKSVIKILVLTILISSCGGNNDTPQQVENKELGDFNLIFPDNNLICTEGTDVGNNVEIDFMWSASANAKSYELEITVQDSGEVIRATTTATSRKVTLAKNTQFSWIVIATLDNKDKESATWNFFSEGISQENFAPFPATINSIDKTNGFVEISWVGADLDNDINKYDFFFGTDSENPEFVASNTSDEGTYTMPIDYGTLYFIEVITTDDRGNTALSKKTINY